MNSPGQPEPDAIYSGIRLLQLLRVTERISEAEAEVLAQDLRDAVYDSRNAYSQLACIRDGLDERLGSPTEFVTGGDITPENSALAAQGENA